MEVRGGHPKQPGRQPIPVRVAETQVCQRERSRVKDQPASNVYVETHGSARQDHRPDAGLLPECLSLMEHPADFDVRCRPGHGPTDGGLIQCLQLPRRNLGS